MAERLQRYILMPQEGLTSTLLTANEFQPSGRRVALAARRGVRTPPQMKVIDAINENGPKLVEMPPEGELSLRLAMPEVKIVPEVFFKRQWLRPEISNSPPSRRPMIARASARRASAQIVIVDRKSGAPLRGASVYALTDVTAEEGAEGVSGADGSVRLPGLSAAQEIEELYVYGPPGYWGFFRASTSLGANREIKLRSVDPRDPDLLLHRLYGKLPADAGNGVTVAVIDTGIDGRHPALPNVTGGLNCVTDETRNNRAAEANWRPARKDGEHGTHVAGVVAARGADFRGVSPGASLRSYRVFPDNGEDASNYDIAKAIARAVADNCQILNLSLGDDTQDDLTRAAIRNAVAAGTIVVCAAGNEFRAPVCFPAAYPESIAVSAMGRRGTFPKESIGSGEIAKPSGGVRNSDFVASFSNVGSQIDTTGPGVEIVSTLPKGKYGPMSGTSMAAPAVAGFAAYLLSADTSLLNARGASRSRQLKDALYSTCKPAGFGRKFEGFGLPTP
jgi:subtilisin